MMTVGTEMRSVKLNGELVEASGNYGNWGSPKEIYFSADRCNPGTIELQGW